MLVDPRHPEPVAPFGLATSNQQAAATIPHHYTPISGGAETWLDHAIRKYIPLLASRRTPMRGDSVRANLLTYDPEEPVYLPRGRYQIPNFDFSALLHPLRVDTGEGFITLRSLATRADLGWPYVFDTVRHNTTRTYIWDSDERI